MSSQKIPAYISFPGVGRPHACPRSLHQSVVNQKASIYFANQNYSPLFYMVQTLINPIWLTSGFPNLDTSSINNINDWLHDTQRSCWGHSLGHLLDPSRTLFFRGHPRAQAAVQLPLSPGQ